MIRRPPRSPLFPSTTLSRPPALRGPAGASASRRRRAESSRCPAASRACAAASASQHKLDSLQDIGSIRSEEHTSELQSPCNLVCRLLLEKKKKTNIPYTATK